MNKTEKTFCIKTTRKLDMDDKKLHLMKYYNLQWNDKKAAVSKQPNIDFKKYVLKKNDREFFELPRIMINN